MNDRGLLVDDRHAACRPEAARRPSFEAVARIVVGVLILVLAAGVGIAVYVLGGREKPRVDFATASHQSIVEAQTRTPDAFDDLAGEVHLSLAAPGMPIRPYVLDPASGELRPTWPDVPGAHYTPARAPADPRRTVVSGYPEGESGPHGRTFQLFLVDTETENVILQLTFDDAAEKRLPQWSPDGTRIAYHALDVPSDGVTSTDILDLGNWGVFVLDVATGASERIADGAMPLWSKDGNEILFANSRGLAAYDLRRGDAFQVIDRGTVGYQRKLGINSARDTVVWTDPRGLIEVYTLGEDRSFLSMEHVREIDTGFADTYWPTFSPDGRYLAFQGVDRTAEATTSPRIVVYDLAVDVSAKAIDIGAFDFLRSFISDWTVD